MRAYVSVSDKGSSIQSHGLPRRQVGHQLDHGRCTRVLAAVGPRTHRAVVTTSVYRCVRAS